MATKQRAIEAASSAFAERGVAATSLDDLARELGVTKQAVLYHFRSKDGLLAAVFSAGAAELGATLAGAMDGPALGWPRVEAAVRAAFDLAVRRPELLGLLREVTRVGPPHSDAVLAELQPLIDRAVASLADQMEAGVFRRADPALLLVSVYAAVTGVVADAGVLRAVGLDLDLRTAARLRRTVLDFLRAALEP
ncbi:MAG: TetR/AcrR family transcriptional regulator [Acidimicrobiales bacterium]